MATEKTNADALRFYLSGAESDGADQPIQALSLGGFRSSVPASGYGFSIDSPIPGVRVDLVSAQNGVGSGALVAVDADTLAWTPPGSTQGAEVAIAIGETKILEGSTASRYIRVTRTSASDLEGTATITTLRCLGTVIAHRNSTVSGLTTYSAIAIKNESGLSITGLQIWIDAAVGSRLFIGYEQDDGAGRISDTTVQGDSAAPDGVTITNQGTSAGAGLQVGTVIADDTIGLWLKRVVPGAADADPEVVQTIHWSYTYSGTVYSGSASGYYRVSDASLVAFLLFRGVDSSPDFTGAPYATFSRLAYVTVLQDPGHTYHYTLRQRNAYGLITRSIEETLKEIDAGGDEVEPNPSAPTETTMDATGAGTVKILSYYEYLADGDDAGDTWLIYLTSNGDDPDPDTDTPIEVEMVLQGGMAELEYDSDAFNDGLTIKAIVRTQRDGTYESQNLNIVSTTSEVANADDAAEKGCCWAVDKDTESVTRVWTDFRGKAYIDLVDETGVFRFVIEGVVVAGLTAGRFFGYAGTLTEEAENFNPPMTDLIEHFPGENSIGFAVGRGRNRTRVLNIDSSGNVRVGAVTLEDAYPFAGVRTGYITQVGSSLDFSADLKTVIMRVTKETAVLGIRSGTLHILGTTGV